MTNSSAAVTFGRRVADRCFRTVAGRLWIGGIPVEDIAAEFGTPLFLYDRDVLERQWRRLLDALPGDFDVHYSMKANPLQAILRFFVERGCGIEVASAGELHQALCAGCPA